jgi:6-O-methylguanine DNA methyltransferase, DNA binding domain
MATALGCLSEREGAALKTWTDKLNAPAEIAIKPAPVTIAGMRAGEIMLVPTAKLVDEFVRTIPKGCSTSVTDMRKALAEAHGAEVTCPIYTGYHIRTVAEAAHEMLTRGVPLSEITPFWRVLDAKAPTTKRLTFGAAFVTEQRTREGLEN